MMIQNPDFAQSARSKHITQGIAFTIIRIIATFTVLPILGIVVYIVVRGLPAISWEFLTAMPRDGMRAGGILPAIIGTFYLMLGTAAFAIPLGLAGGIYLSEYSEDNAWTRLIRVAIISLAGVPSVVY
ncbi:MAG: phosphate ABC transporter, permease protein PstA, partial [Chloroflexi bacterium]|nr:phosphate ABC transporter, permease protein PstA [Chloroflexota bacterium]